jgi:hypothetical protein
MSTWIKAERDIYIYVNIDHIIYFIVIKHTPEEEGLIEYHVRGALVSAPKEEILFSVKNSQEEAEEYIKKILKKKKAHEKI